MHDMASCPSIYLLPAATAAHVNWRDISNSNTNSCLAVKDAYLAGTSCLAALAERGSDRPRRLVCIKGWGAC